MSKRTVTEYHFMWDPIREAWKMEAFAYKNHHRLFQCVGLAEDITANSILEFMVHAQTEIAEQMETVNG